MIFLLYFDFEVSYSVGTKGHLAGDKEAVAWNWELDFV
jgi:hypothetical protein